MSPRFTCGCRRERRSDSLFLAPRCPTDRLCCGGGRLRGRLRRHGLPAENDLQGERRTLRRISRGHHRIVLGQAPALPGTAPASCCSGWPAGPLPSIFSFLPSSRQMMKSGPTDFFIGTAGTGASRACSTCWTPRTLHRAAKTLTDQRRRSLVAMTLLPAKVAPPSPRSAPTSSSC